MKKLLIISGIVIILLLMASCATQDNIFGQVPDEQNIPLNQQMPPIDGN